MRRRRLSGRNLFKIPQSREWVPMLKPYSDWEEIEKRFNQLSVYRKILSLNKARRLLETDSQLTLLEALRRTVIFDVYRGDI